MFTVSSGNDPGRYKNNPLHRDKVKNDYYMYYELFLERCACIPIYPGSCHGCITQKKAFHTLSFCFINNIFSQKFSAVHCIISKSEQIFLPFCIIGIRCYTETCGKPD